MILACSFGLFTCDSALAQYVRFVDSTSQSSGFSTKVIGNDKYEYSVASTVLEHPTYETSPGKTRITIKRDKVVVVNQVVPGQYHLLGFDTERGDLYAFHMGQYGAEFRILNIVVFNRATPKGRALGPDGGYQYGASSSDGAFCILVDFNLVVVDLQTGKAETYLLDKFNGVEADPERLTETGKTFGANANLTGEFMEMKWTSRTSGKLIIRNADKSRVREIPVKLEMRTDPSRKRSSE